jgi:hypothetical protein
LSDMNCHDCLNSGSDLLVHIFQAHLCKVRKNTVEELLLLVELDNLLFVASFKAFSDILGPKDLNTEESNLRWVGKRVVSCGHGVAVLSSCLAFDSD